MAGPCGTGLLDPTALALESRGSIGLPGCITPAPQQQRPSRAAAFPALSARTSRRGLQGPARPRLRVRSVSGCEREGGGYPPRDKRRGPSKWKLESRVACRPAFQATLSHAGRPEARTGAPASRTLDSSVLGLARILECTVWRVWFYSHYAACGGRARHSPVRVESVVSSPGLGCGHLDGSRDSGTFSRERRADPPRGGGSRVRGHDLGGPGEKPRLQAPRRPPSSLVTCQAWSSSPLVFKLLELSEDPPVFVLR